MGDSCEPDSFLAFIKDIACEIEYASGEKPHESKESPFEAEIDPP